MGENTISTDKKAENLGSNTERESLCLEKDAVPILSIPSAVEDGSHCDELKFSLSYLPRGIGIIIGGYTNRRLMD